MATPSLEAPDFERHRARILVELEHRTAVLRGAGRKPLAATTIASIFHELFGDADEVARTGFLIFVAPLLRRLTMSKLASVEITNLSRIDIIELEQWLARLEGFDARCVLMIDLHYFVGLSTRRTAATLGISPQAVVRDLRFAKAWLQARIRWVGKGR